MVKDESQKGKMDPHKLGYYNYPDVLKILGNISPKTLSNALRTLKITPKTGIVDNRQKFLSRIDIVKIHADRHKIKPEECDITAIDFSVVDESIFEETMIPEKKVEKPVNEDITVNKYDENITVKGYDTDEGFDEDTKEYETINVPAKSDEFNMNKQMVKWHNDLMEIRELKGRQEEIVERQALELANAKRKIIVGRVFLWFMATIALVAAWKGSEMYTSMHVAKERNIAVIKEALQQSQNEKYKLSVDLNNAAILQNIAVKKETELRQMVEEYKTLANEQKILRQSEYNREISEKEANMMNIDEKDQN